MAQPKELHPSRARDIPSFVTELLQTRESTERLLEGKVALVIGATGNIGGGISLALALRGAGILGIHRDQRKNSRAQPVIDAINSCDVASEFPVLDINNVEDRTTTRQIIKEKFGGQLDFLVLNASVGPTLTKESVMELVDELLPFMPPGGKIFLMQSTPAHFSRQVTALGTMPEVFGNVVNEKYQLWQMLLDKKSKFDERQISLISICAPLVPETTNFQLFYNRQDPKFEEKNNALSDALGLPRTVTIKEIGEKVAELATHDDLPFGYVELFGNVYDARSALREAYGDDDILVETIINHGQVKEGKLWESRYLVTPEDCQESLSNDQLKKAAEQILEAIAYYTGTPTTSLDYPEYPEKPVQPGDILTIQVLTKIGENDTFAKVLIGKKPGLTKTA